MKPSTLKALRQSIAHWRRMATGKSKPGESPVGSQCALCRAFYSIKLGVCDGCPVKKKTGFNLCHRTPFHQAATFWRSSGIASTVFKLAAKVELAFLRSLLPKKKKKK